MYKKPMPSYDKWTESQMANLLIKYWQRIGCEVKPEVHYNNYGTRGVIDVYNIDGKVATELKSEKAVREATGANEIVRQYNKMVSNFNEGQNKTANKFDLLFSPSEYVINHLIDNMKIYNSVIDKGFKRIGLLFQGPEDAAFQYIISDNKHGKTKLPNSLHDAEKWATDQLHRNTEAPNTKYLVANLRVKR